MDTTGQGSAGASTGYGGTLCQRCNRMYQFGEQHFCDSQTQTGYIALALQLSRVEGKLDAIIALMRPSDCTKEPA